MQIAGLVSCLATAVLTAGYLFTPMSVLLSAASGLAGLTLCSGKFWHLTLNKGDLNFEHKIFLVYCYFI